MNILLLVFTGTRYKRRGVDPDGHVANYVETEQILLYHHYALSFLQVISKLTFETTNHVSCRYSIHSFIIKSVVCFAIFSMD